MKYLKIIIAVLAFVLAEVIWFTIANVEEITIFKSSFGFDIQEYKIIDYNPDEGQVNLSITPSRNTVECGVLIDNEINYEKVDNSNCLLRNSLSPYKVYLKDKKNNISKAFIIDNYIAKVNIKDTYTVPLNTPLEITNDIIKVNNPRIDIESNDSNLVINNNIITSNIEGTFTINVYGNGDLLKTTELRVIDPKLEDKYYVPLNSYLDLTSNIPKDESVKLEVKSKDSNLLIDNNIIISNLEGTFDVEISANNNIIKKTKIVVTDVITEKPKLFNLSKPYLTCKEYEGDKAKLLDEILNFRMNSVEYGTRASVVEAARFITLEFPRRVAYYWENGRLYKTGRHYIDGEGRYYHKGLYLSTDKYKDIVASMQGPQMWGCKMINWQDDPPDFVRNQYYPNGLDCSGFVSWVLLNGGFDVGDKGAGPVGGAYDLTDLGDFRYMSNSLINSGLIKVGDLFSTSGHIAILIGMDSNYFYVAESLNHYGGVVMRKYQKTQITRNFQHVVMMDEVYKKDGELTNLWY